MLENCRSAKERWGGVNNIIDRWLHERQQLLVEYCNLSAVQVFDEENPLHQEQLKQLCQILVDYVSAGHFEVYEQLIKEGRDFNEKHALKQAAELYKIIDNTTESLLDFNDKYQETDDLADLAIDLSIIGQQLETQFTAEDQMIEVLHTCHKELVA
ncbi:anti-RNA polymerase sigma 70 factor [Candidatus Endobugula sertula]|uniref:Anti-RNA polymerase sigma 70 factor n=1 Tax=Candidatus Endobugula sertula TaxID=62101 RepID=A0A1D2QRC9_9GAMM|nr:anti-RNA polymerase sigma 70 factor [Candidatus Endobugula sertula]